MYEALVLVFFAVAGSAAAIWWISPGEHRMPSRNHPVPTVTPTFQAPRPPAAPTFQTDASEPFDHEHVPPPVIEALDRGDVLDAIRQLRDASGLGLGEAKAIVDAIQRRRGAHDFSAEPPPIPGAGAHVPPAVLEAVDRGEIIQAIKRYREATGVGLAEAKAVIDDVRRRRGQ